MEESELDAFDTRTRRFVIYEASRRRLPFDAIADAIAAGLDRETIEAMPREDFRALRGHWKPGTVVAVESVDGARAAKPVATKHEPVRQGG